jgi:hypothetical protein
MKGSKGAQPSGCRTAGIASAIRDSLRAPHASSFCRLKTALLAFLLAAPGPSVACAQVQVLAGNEPQTVFGGREAIVAVRLRNPTNNPVEAELHTRVYQASSATTMAIGEAPWKKLTVLPGQTVLESATVAFPAVIAETRFLLQWLDGTNKVIGVTEVLGYPPDLLKELKPLVGEDPLGVLDPLNQLKPLLKAADVEYQDLEDSGLENYHGKLAIIGPFRGRAQMPEDLPKRIKALAQKGVAVVWIQQPSEEKRKELKPSFYLVPEIKGAVVVVRADQVTNLAENPIPQLNLIQFACLATHPEPPRLPQLTPSN